MTPKINAYTRLLFCIALLVACSVSTADTLIIPEISSQPPNTRNSVLRPVRSMTMDQVKTKFGEPLEVIAPIGSPPITRWIYEKFVVHFEHNYVIHSVVKK